MKRITTALLLLFTGVAGATDHTSTLSLGYANQRSNGAFTGNAVGGNIKYHWDAIGNGLGIIGSATYTTANINGPLSRKTGNASQYSLLVGPSYRFNEYVSVYTLAGFGSQKLKISNVDTQKNNSFAYGFGVQVNPGRHWVVDVSYELSRYSVDLPNSERKNNSGTLVLGAGYRF